MALAIGLMLILCLFLLLVALVLDIVSTAFKLRVKK